MCESNCGIFQQYFYFVRKLLTLHLVSEILEFDETNEMGKACSAYGEDRGVHRMLVGKPEGKRPL
jgi:hypothetical protein